MMVPQGQASIGGIEYWKSIYPHAAKGVPIDMAPLKEGLSTGINSMTLVKKRRSPSRIPFINHMLAALGAADGLSSSDLWRPSVEGINVFAPVRRWYRRIRRARWSTWASSTRINYDLRYKVLERYNQLFTQR